LNASGRIGRSGFEGLSNTAAHEQRENARSPAMKIATLDSIVVSSARVQARRFHAVPKTL
jgi:hypothetical protein